MAAHEDQPLHINDLPEELLNVITSYLPLSDRKSLSMASPFWNQHAFSFSSMNDVKLRINGFMVEQRDLSSLHGTERPYRHLVFSFGHRPCTELDFAVVRGILTRLGPTIESFALMNSCTLKQFKELINRLPNLRLLSLNVVQTNDQPIDLRQLPIMRHLKELRMNNNMLIESWMTTFRAAPNIRKLNMNLMGRVNGLEQSLDFIKLYEHQLESFELFAPDARLPYDQLRLRQLHTLKLWGIQCERDERELCVFFENLPVLQVALLHFNVSAKVLEVVCTKCACLYKLRIKVDALNGNCIRVLGNLTRLRVLLIDGYLKRDMIENCSPLNNVEYFCLTKNPLKLGASMEQLSHLFPRLRTLKIDLSYGMQMNDCFIQGIGHHFNQITCLFIDAIHVCSVGSVEFVSPQVFGNLMQLTNLQELTLSCMRLSVAYCFVPEDNCLFIHFLQLCFGEWNERPHMNLRRLKLKNCNWVEGDILVNVVQLFPSLQYLEVRRCRLITPEDMAVFREVMPACVVHCAK